MSDDERVGDLSPEDIGRIALQFADAVSRQDMGEALRLLALIVHDEREKCAKFVDGMYSDGPTVPPKGSKLEHARAIAAEIAEAIREL